MRDVRSVVVYIVIAVWSLQSLVTSALYWHRREKDCIKYRSPGFTVIAALTAYILVCITVLPWAEDGLIPCFIRLWIASLAYPVMYLSATARALRLLCFYRISEAKLATQTSSSISSRNSQTITITHVTKKPSSQLSVIESPNPLYHETLANNWYYQNRRLFSVTFFAQICCAIVFIHIVVLIIIQYYTRKFSIKPTVAKDNCSVGWEWLPHRLYIVVYAVAVSPFILLKLRGIHDAYGIREELIALTITNSVFDLVFLILFALNAFGGLNPDFYGLLLVIVPISLIHCFLIIRPLCESYGIYFTRLAVKRNRLHKNLQFTPECFERILQDPVLMEQFKSFAAKDFTVENVLFFERCQAISRRRESDPAWTQQQLRETYTIFIEPDAELMVNLDAETFLRIRTDVSLEKFQPDMYTQAQAEIKELMFHNTFPRFLESVKYNNSHWVTDSCMA
ncbi:hypothetical protein K493DRAFT_368907 [Basidiobolus meristosporus CBS 931.73]|uniref:RGS domain-containing protein n=1 Tax=Basidiobolus meristosporus CBS 931.73 TaxID=1314790 RepID=A0A1Y1YIA4_9FUNG|nr:hypothetical protein K493DRAFT_368907 [Basidiobolus meristosporus CBS 931.73]|eukprot:ORX97777.1 hypothetical protein K493DRAFT_368907 [Basidiobolus meristosporus CBS 931.73]